MKKLLVAFLGLGSVLTVAAAGGCAHSGGGGGGSGVSGFEEDCGLDSYYPYTTRHGLGQRPQSVTPCGSRGWEPSAFLQSTESALPARAQIASPEPHRRPHPRFVDRPDDSTGFSRDASGSNGASSSGSGSSASGGGTVHLSQPSPTFSAPAPSSPPPSPPSPPSSHAPPNR